MATYALDGIMEKLEWSKQKISDLNREIDVFLSQGRCRSICENDTESLREAIAYHSGRKIPIRFSVIVGEVIYQLRSSLDHLAWQLVISNNGRPDTDTEFPIFYENKPAAIDRKIKGIEGTIQARIKELQPYHAGDGATDHPLWIVHYLNKIDKHHELILVMGWFARIRDRFVMLNCLNLQNGAVVQNGFPTLVNEERAVSMDGQITTQIAFGQFGQRENQPVIPSLMELLDTVEGIVNLFRDEVCK